MTALPEDLVASLPGDERAAVHAWWAQLPQQAKQELAVHWDARAASCSHSWIDEGGEARWEEMPILVGVRFLPPDEQDDPDDAWNVDFYEYLINNPELGFLHNGRTFHICRTHPVARTVLKAGVIPAEFRCPMAGRECPMQNLLQQRAGSRVVLFGRRLTPLSVRTSP